MSDFILKLFKSSHIVEQYTANVGRSSLMIMFGELDPTANVSSNQPMYTEIEHSQRTCVRVLERCH